MAGLDVISAATSLISFSFQIFQGCVEGYRFIREAQAIGKEGDFLRVRLLLEQVRLVEWADRAGLGEGSLGNLRLNWGLINDILEQEKALLTSGERLKNLYGLDTQDQEDEVNSDSNERQDTSSGRGIERFFSRLRPDLGTTTKAARRIQSSNGTFRRIKWAAVGKDDTKRIVNDLSLLNDQLIKLLETAEMHRMQEQLDALLRGVLSLCTRDSEVEIFQQLLGREHLPHETSLAAAAALKSIRLIIDVDKRHDEIRARANHSKRLPRLTLLSERKLHYDVVKAENGIQLAEYRKMPVLVQWKEVSTAVWELFEKQMKRLALLLSNASDESFHCLPFQGLAILREKGRFGLVYSIPTPGTAEVCATTWKTLSLYDMIVQVPKASLSLRLRVAQCVTEAVIQLHTAGWLHKGIRSGNVIFVAEASMTYTDMIHTTPYLIGYDYSRPDTDTAATEVAETAVEADLYRHPHCRGTSRDRFVKSFDMFALGCLLVEVGLWRRLGDIQSRYYEYDLATAMEKAQIEDSAIDLPSLLDVSQNEEFADEIKHSTGDVYWEAVQTCLSTRESSTDDQEASLEAELSVLKKIKSCVLSI